MSDSGRELVSVRKILVNLTVILVKGVAQGGGIIRDACKARQPGDESGEESDHRRQVHMDWVGANEMEGYVHFIFLSSDRLCFCLFSLYHFRFYITPPYGYGKITEKGWKLGKSGVKSEYCYKQGQQSP